MLGVNGIATSIRHSYQIMIFVSQSLMKNIFLMTLSDVL